MAWFWQHPVFAGIIACIIPNIGGFLGSLLTDTSADSWYGKLVKPVFNPPNWLFFPAWTILYLSIGFASFRVWYKGGGFTGKARIPLIFFAIQMVLNWIWTPIFFGFEALGWAFAEIIVMIVFVVITTGLFFKVDRIAGFLMWPYIGWLIFASCLNGALWQLN